LGHILRDHVKALLLFWVETDTHVEYYVGVAQLVQHLDLFDKVLKSFAGHPALAKFFDSDACAIPASFVDITEATLT